jgi:hypothetical protein
MAANHPPCRDFMDIPGNTGQPTNRVATDRKFTTKLKNYLAYSHLSIHKCPVPV